MVVTVYDCTIELCSIPTFRNLFGGGASSTARYSETGAPFTSTAEGTTGTPAGGKALAFRERSTYYILI